MAAKKTEGEGSRLRREDIERIIDLIHQKGIEEFELEQDGMRIRIVASRPDHSGGHYTTGQVHQHSASILHAPAATNIVAGTSSSQPTSADQEDPNLKRVTSPMVGTFYRSPSPGSKPFVEVGDKVDEDTVLCIIEAMKLMNEIKAETRGVVRKILAENAHPVEYGQVVFLIEPL